MLRPTPSQLERLSDLLVDAVAREIEAGPKNTHKQEVAAGAANEPTRVTRTTDPAPLDWKAGAPRGGPP